MTYQMKLMFWFPNVTAADWFTLAFVIALITIYLETVDQ